MQWFKPIVAGVVLCAIVGVVAVGCEKEGPAEKAGKKVDEALDAAKKEINKLTDEK